MHCRGEPFLTVLTSLQLFLFRTVRRAGPVPFTQCVTKGSFKARWQETTYNFFTFSCLFLLPLTAMTICYSRIVLSVSSPQSRKSSPGETQAPALTVPGTHSSSLSRPGCPHQTRREALIYSITQCSLLSFPQNNSNSSIL